MLGLLGIPTLIAGLILRYADNPPWFRGAHNVGHILILCSVIYIVVSVVLFLYGAHRVQRRRASQAATRRRRGF